MKPFHPNNYYKNNTPPWAQKIGDILLLAGGVGISILGFPAMVAMAVPGLVIVLPPVIHGIGAGLAAAGVAGKIFAKLFAKEDTARKYKAE